MLECNFTIAGVLSLFILLLTYIKYNFNVCKLLTDPISIICILFFKNFGLYKTINLTLTNDLLLVLSFIISIASYYIAKRTKINSIERRLIHFPKREKRTNGNVLASNKGILAFFLISVLYCVTDLSVNTLIFGSVENALIRFYSNVIQDTEYVSLRNYLSILYKLMVSLVFVYRYFLNIKHKTSSLFIIGVLLLVFVTIPGGSRGRVLSPIVSIILADIFSKRFRNVSLKRHYIQYLYLGLIAGISFLVLTSIRSIKFKSFDDVRRVVEMVDISSSADEFVDREGELIITDAKLCFDKFGNQVDFLPVYYTAISIVVSFVPRSFWEDKPVSFGFIINALKEGKNNTIRNPHKTYYPGAIDWAAGVAGEGWANGGLVGLIVYSILFGFVSGKCARMYYSLMRYDNNYLAIILALCLYQMTFCFIRGSLQSTFTPSLYSFILLLIIIKILYYKHESIRCSRSLG